MPGAFASTPLELPPPSEEDDDDEDEEEASAGWQAAYFFLDLCFAKFLRGSLPKFWSTIYCSQKPLAGCYSLGSNDEDTAQSMGQSIPVLL